MTLPAGETAVMPTYARYPLTLVRGEGLTVWGDVGGAYLDFAGAIGANPLGHGHPAWKRAIHDQVETLDLTSNLFATDPQAKLAARLTVLRAAREACDLHGAVKAFAAALQRVADEVGWA